MYTIQYEAFLGSLFVISTDFPQPKYSSTFIRSTTLPHNKLLHWYKKVPVFHTYCLCVKMSTRDTMDVGLDREKTEKSKINSQIKHVPKDAQVIMSILKESGINEYEPRVINQLLEFTYSKVFRNLFDHY